MLTLTKVSRIFMGLFLPALSWLSALGQTNHLRSIYGMGLELSGANSAQRAMGISQALSDFTSINLLNPASYGYVYKQGMLRKITLDLGFNATLQNTLANQVRSQGTDVQINHVSLRFPLHTGLGLVMALQPQALTSFSRSSAQLDSVVSGSANQALIGLGYNFRKWSFGLNLGYLFGKKQQSFTPIAQIPVPNINQSSELSSLSSNPNEPEPNVVSPAVLPALERLRMHDFYQGMSLNWGLLFAQRLSSDSADIAHTYVKFGATARYTPLIAGERLSNHDILHGSNFQPKDTLVNALAIRGMPLKLGFGAVLTREQVWLLGIDLLFSRWRNFQYAEEQADYRDTWQLNLGGEFIVHYKGGNPLDYVKLKLGAGLGNYPLNFQGRQVWQWSLHTGLYVPIKRHSYTYQSSAINLAFEYVNQQSGAGFQAQFFNLIIGIALSDLWFLKSYQR